MGIQHHSGGRCDGLEVKHELPRMEGTRCAGTVGGINRKAIWRQFGTGCAVSANLHLRLLC